MLDMASLPDELYTPDVPTEKWLDRCAKAGPEGFPAGCIKPLPIHWKVELERIIDIPLYMAFNWAPFVLPAVTFVFTGWKGLVLFVLAVAALSAVQAIKPTAEAVRKGQYIFTERNNQKYTSMRVVWPVGTTAQQGPVIYVCIPHGAAPLGVTCYPLWTRLGGVLCRWTTAPVVLKIPLVGTVLKSIGMIPAKGKDISAALRDRQSVGVILDGIAGM